MSMKSEKAQGGIAVVTTGAVLIIAVIMGLFMLWTPQIIPENNVTLEKFSSYDALVKAFENGRNYYNDYSVRDMMISPMAMTNAAVGGVMQKSSAESVASDYSKTNIQFEGVDEADIVKNDGKYIYAIAKGKLFIVDAYPAETAKIVSAIELGDRLTPQEMFISLDSKKLMVFASSGNYYGGYDYEYTTKTTTITSTTSSTTSGMTMPYWENRSYVAVVTYDISDKSNPKLTNQTDFEGSYLNSRLIGDKAYFVINSYPEYGPYYQVNSGSAQANDGNSIIPLMRINGVEKRVAQATDIAIMPRVRVTNFVTIAALDIKTGEMTKETVAGSANNLYASENNIYLAEEYYEYADYNGPIPLEIGMMVKSIYMPQISTTEKTAVSKFHVENGKISFGGQGVAPGHILNQFSMDEYNGNFRIATTVGAVSRSGESQSKNNVYIFNKDMNMTGALEGLAPGEKIYSARFMGNKGYLVTFKKVDPLFVLDLSNPTDPKVLGKLKIPGYSDYLHPIDETHIIGIGKDTIESNYGTFAWYQGLKMAIFDVSDVNNPKEMHKIVIGDRGTDSLALSDHKAFLYDKEKSLLVIPITLAEIQDKTETNPESQRSSPSYGEQTFQGAMVYNVTLENGFIEKGRITHVSAEEELKSGYYYDYNSQILRSLFMDNVLYTLSDKMLKANNLTTLESITEVKFTE